MKKIRESEYKIVITKLRSLVWLEFLTWFTRVATVSLEPREKRFGRKNYNNNDSHKLLVVDVD